MRIPMSPTELDRSWVEAHLGPHLRGTPDSVECTRVGAEFGLAGVTYRLVCHGATAQDVFAVKVCAIEAARHEARVYKVVLPRTQVPAPAFVALLENETKGILITRFIEAAVQGDVLAGCTEAQSVALTRILAELHAPWWGGGDDAVPLSLRSRAPVATVVSDAMMHRCVARHGACIPGGAEALRTQLSGVGEARAVLTRQPMTMAHRDYHLDNVLFTESGSFVLDWEGARRAPAAYDLARFLVECHRPQQQVERQDQVRRLYLEQLAERGVVLDYETLDEGVAAARRVLLTGTVRWAGAEHPAEPGSRQEGLQRNLLQGLMAVL